MVETECLGAGCRCWCGAVSWLCTWWRHGCRCWVLAVHVVETAGAERRCCELAVRVVETGCRCWALAVRVVETGCRVLGAGCWCWVLGIPVLGAGAGRRELACRCSVLVPASDSEVITTSAACSSEGRPSAASDNEVPVVMGRVNLFTQHHTVLSLERSLSISALFRSCFGRQLCQGLYCLRAYFCTYTYNVLCATSGSQPAIVSAVSVLHTQ